MRFNFLVSSLLLLFSGFVFADETTGKRAATEERTPASSSKPTEEMIIHSQTVVAKKRGELESKLKRLGYKKFIRKKGRTIVRHDIAYRPTVMLDDDGWIDIRRSPIRFEPPGKAAERQSKLRYLWCLPPFTVMCVRVGGQTVSRRRMMTYKRRIGNRSRSYVRDWQEAIIGHAMDQRLTIDIPNMLDSIWTNGQTDGDDGPYLGSHKERRETIMHFWSNRSCIKEGAQAREVVRDFIVHEIQASNHPAGPDEIAQANASQRCENASLLPMTHDR